MTIEALLTRVAEALEANTSAMQALMKDSAKSTGTKTDAPKTSASKPAAGKTTKQKGSPTVEDVTARVTTYLKTGSKAERDERKEHVKTIIEHYEVDRFTNIDPASFEEALGFLDAYEAGDDPFSGGGADEGDEGDEGDDDTMV